MESKCTQFRSANSSRKLHILQKDINTYMLDFLSFRWVLLMMKLNMSCNLHSGSFWPAFVQAKAMHENWSSMPACVPHASMTCARQMGSPCRIPSLSVKESSHILYTTRSTTGCGFAAWSFIRKAVFRSHMHKQRKLHELPGLCL